MISRSAPLPRTSLFAEIIVHKPGPGCSSDVRSVIGTSKCSSPESGVRATYAIVGQYRRKFGRPLRRRCGALASIQQRQMVPERFRIPHQGQTYLARRLIGIASVAQGKFVRHLLTLFLNIFFPRSIRRRGDTNNRTQHRFIQACVAGDQAMQSHMSAPPAPWTTRQPFLNSKIPILCGSCRI